MNDTAPKRWRLAHILLVTALLAGAGFAAQHYLYVPAIAVTHIERGQSVTAVYASGNVEPTVMMKIAPKAMGRLTELLVDENAAVKAGQILARLDDQELAASLDQLQARVELAGREAERAAALHARGSGTVQERDRTQSALQEARAAYAVAEKQRKEYTLTAPADGLIIRRDGEVGEVIAVNQPVFYMSCCAPLRITANIDEEDMPLVAVGQSVLIRADAFPGKTFSGTVDAITPKGDATARNFRIRIGLPADSPLFIGMSTEINIVVGVDNQAWLLPATALRDGKVWLVRDGRLEQVAVVTGPANGDKIAIKSGLDPYDNVVTAPGENLKQGEKRRIAGGKD